MPEWVAAGLVVAVGLVAGSFANACIYRLPRGISLAEPRRSFCPACGTPLKWWWNVPVVSFVALRGRCGACGQRIGWRYPVVEVICGGLAGALWWLHPWPVAAVFFLLGVLLVIGSFVDAEFLILPDEVTLGGLAAGLAASAAWPGLHGAGSWHGGLMWSAAGAAAGGGLLWVVAEAGKAVFGRKVWRPERPERFAWRRDAQGRAELEVGGERVAWEELFYRASDELVMECEEVEGAGLPAGARRLVWRRGSVRAGEGPEVELEGAGEIRGVVREVVVPREAMGFGDVKLLAGIGAFLGWQGVIFTVAAGSVLGSVWGVMAWVRARWRGGEGAAELVPFGPFLSAGAVLWMLGGQVVWEAYWARWEGWLAPGWR